MNSLLGHGENRQNFAEVSVCPQGHAGTEIYKLLFIHMPVCMHAYLSICLLTCTSSGVRWQGRTVMVLFVLPVCLLSCVSVCLSSILTVASWLLNLLGTVGHFKKILLYFVCTVKQTGLRFLLSVWLSACVCVHVCACVCVCVDACVCVCVCQPVSVSFRTFSFWILVCQLHPLQKKDKC